MKKFTTDIKSQDVEKIINDKVETIMADEKFCAHLNDLGFDEKTIRENILIIVDYYNDYKVCSNCTNVSTCGLGEHYIKLISLNDNLLTFEYDVCEKYKKINRVKNLSTFCDISDEFLTKSAKNDLKKTENRKQLVTTFMEILKKGSKKFVFVESKKGCGGTFITSIFYKEIVFRNSMSGNYIHAPKRFAELSENLFNNKAEFAKKMDELQNCEILVINKLSNFNFNEFTRNNILFPILENRLSNNLTTIITSELEYEDFITLLNVKNSNKDVRFKQINELLDSFERTSISTKIKIF